METDDVIERVCRLPIDFYNGSKSMLQLVAESGIQAHLAALSPKVLESYIRDHPHIVEHWLRWSANKRVTSGWFFSHQAGGFSVGFHPQGAVLNFTEPATACAEFVIREVSGLAAMLDPKKRNN